MLVKGHGNVFPKRAARPTGGEKLISVITGGVKQSHAGARAYDIRHCSGEGCTLHVRQNATVTRG